jgi:hypothetical protein
MPKWNLEEAIETRDVDVLRRIVFFDHMKTASFGVIGASVFAPLFRGEAIQWTSCFPIGVAFAFLAFMVIWPELVR